MNGFRNRLAAIFTLSIFGLQLMFCSGQSTAFTYQGRLNDARTPANGSYDVQFALFDSSTNGNLIAGPLTNSAVAVNNGLFSAAVDFGAAAFEGDRWLEISVRTNGALNFTTLTTRQQITPAPYAIQALNASSVAASNVTGALDVSQLPSAVVTNGGSDQILSGRFSGDGSGLTNVALLYTNQTFTGTNTFAQTAIFSGRVGIGTNNPPVSLWVQGSASNSRGVIHGLQTAGNLAGAAVYGKSVIPGGVGLTGEADVPGPVAADYPVGVYGNSTATNGVALLGISRATNAFAAYLLGRAYVNSDPHFGGLLSSNSPATLQVAGGILARGGPPGPNGISNNGYSFQGNSGDNDSGMFSSQNGSIEFYNDSLEAMRITSGWVGIGTTNPLAPLDVFGANEFPQLRVSVPAESPFGAFLSLDASAATGGKNYLIFSTANDAGEGQGKLIVQNHTDGVQIMSVTSDGKVGIGTLAPQSSLQVVGDVRLGPDGTNFAASGQENLRMVRGIVNGNGTTSKGSGYIPNRSSLGMYTVTFNTPFSDVPTVTASGRVTDAQVGALTTNSVIIHTVNVSSGGAVDDVFNFIAVGPQ